MVVNNPYYRDVVKDNGKPYATINVAYEHNDLTYSRVLKVGYRDNLQTIQNKLKKLLNKKPALDLSGQINISNFSH